MLELPMQFILKAVGTYLAGGNYGYGRNPIRYDGLARNLRGQKLPGKGQNVRFGDFNRAQSAATLNTTRPQHQGVIRLAESR